MKKKLFECVGGNQFRLLKLVCEETEKPFFGWTTEPGTTDVDINTLPVTLNDLFSSKAEYLGADSTDPEDQKTVQDWKSTAKILAARKVPGFGDNFRRSSNPDDFIYEVDVTYVNRHEGGQRWHMLFGVSKDGKNIQLFAS